MTLAFSRRPADEERRALILGAAERAFAAHGFRAATMSQVADEAGMSAGNLYRYFPSKEAIVEGLCRNDQTQQSEVFASLSSAQDLKLAMRAMLRERVLCKSGDKARMIVEIWAEAGRNARVAEFFRRLERDVLEHLISLVDLAKRRGAASPKLDSPFAARVLFTLIAGLLKRRAVEPAFDVETEIAMAIGVFEALFAGALAPCRET